MELIHKIIPPEILYSLPGGIKFINRHGKEFLVIEDVRCPNGHSLFSEAVRLHGEPSIKLNLKIAGTEGAVFVDSYWGSHEKLFSFIPDLSGGDLLEEVTCPTCGTTMLVDEPCLKDGCGSHKSIKLLLPGGLNCIYVCSRLGCPGHRIDIQDIPVLYTEKISSINFFGSHEEGNLFEGI